MTVSDALTHPFLDGFAPIYPDPPPSPPDSDSGFFHVEKQDGSAGYLDTSMDAPYGPGPSYNQAAGPSGFNGNHAADVNNNGEASMTSVEESLAETPPPMSGSPPGLTVRSRLQRRADVIDKADENGLALPEPSSDMIFASSQEQQAREQGPSNGNGARAEGMANGKGKGKGANKRGHAEMSSGDDLEMPPQTPVDNASLSSLSEIEEDSEEDGGARKNDGAEEDESDQELYGARMAKGRGKGKAPAKKAVAKGARDRKATTEDEMVGTVVPDGRRRSTRVAKVRRRL